MEKFKTLLKWYNLTAVIVILLVAVVFASVESTDVGKARPDVINIDSIKTFGDLERPSVLFLHDKHTHAVEKAGGECNRCHATKDGKLSQKVDCIFKNSKTFSTTFLNRIFFSL